jgi:hypothetical protein
MFSFPGLQRVPVLSFGRRRPFTYDTPEDQAGAASLSEDARLFITTFLGGLLFMTVDLA